MSEVCGIVWLEVEAGVAEFLALKRIAVHAILRAKKGTPRRSGAVPACLRTCYDKHANTDQL